MNNYDYDLILSYFILSYRNVLYYKRPEYGKFIYYGNNNK